MGTLTSKSIDLKQPIKCEALSLAPATQYGLNICEQLFLLECKKGVNVGL